MKLQQVAGGFRIGFIVAKDGPIRLWLGRWTLTIKHGKYEENA